jgi:hypothetical protein
MPRTRATSKSGSRRQQNTCCRYHDERLARERELDEIINGELIAANEVTRQLVRDLTAAKENQLLLHQQLNTRKRYPLARDCALVQTDPRASPTGDWTGS